MSASKRPSAALPSTRGSLSGSLAQTAQSTTNLPNSVGTTVASRPPSANPAGPIAGHGPTAAAAAFSAPNNVSKPPASRLALSKEEEEEFKAIFRSIDVDGSGSVSPQELANLMRTLNLNVSEREVRALVKEIDENGDGNIQFEEFIGVLSRKANVSYTAQDVKKAFSIIAGAEHQGMISLDVLKETLRRHSNGALTREQIEDLTNQLKPFTDPSGNLYFNEYVSAVMGE